VFSDKIDPLLHRLFLRVTVSHATSLISAPFFAGGILQQILPPKPILSRPTAIIQIIVGIK
jgi:hypothetical protein